MFVDSEIICPRTVSQPLDSADLPNFEEVFNPRYPADYDAAWRHLSIDELLEVAQRAVPTFRTAMCAATDLEYFVRIATIENRELKYGLIASWYTRIAYWLSDLLGGEIVYPDDEDVYEHICFAIMNLFYQLQETQILNTKEIFDRLQLVCDRLTIPQRQ